MPSNVAGLVLFVVLLFPGYVYERRRSRDIADRQRTPFRETLSVIFVGALADSVFLLFAVLFAVLGPSWAPDVYALISRPGPYLDTHPLRGMALLLWIVGGGCALGYLCAARPWRPVLRRRWPDRYRREHLRDPQQSAWWLLFHAKPGHRIYVGCYLDNGAYVSGLLHSFSRAETETADRELTLRADPAHPLCFRPGGVRDAGALENVGAVSVSARHIVVLTASYLRPNNPTSTRPGEGT
ncbi:DUF6338 family protein [Streptomyces anulatus]